MKDVEHHGVPSFLGPNFQKLGGMRSSPIGGFPLFFIMSKPRKQEVC